MKKITILLRAPFLEKIPSLKTLIIYFAEHKVEVIIISPKSDKYLLSDFSMYPNIHQILVAKRKQKFEIPTSIKLMWMLLIDMLHGKSNYYIGGDYAGTYLLSILRKVANFKIINFLLEYPNINDSKELHLIENADYIITHDKWHAEFIRQYCNIMDNQILYLPNASFTPEYHKESDYLGSRLSISNEKNIILHSGGLGKWFCCKELAESVNKWDKNNVLVFHTSYIVEKEPYYESMKEYCDNCNNVYFSICPVPNAELDELIASAKIGIALYSISELGYRAENMGLAAGKIGNYLKCGVPVIATKVHSLSYLEDFKCGILVDNVEEINDAIKKIIDNYDVYAENAYKCYRELWYPEKYLKHIINELHV